MSNMAIVRCTECGAVLATEFRDYICRDCGGIAPLYRIEKWQETISSAQRDISSLQNTLEALLIHTESVGSKRIAEITLEKIRVIVERPDMYPDEMTFEIGQIFKDYDKAFSDD